MPHIHVFQESSKEGVGLIRASSVPVHKKPQSLMTPQIMSSVLVSRPIPSCGYREKSPALQVLLSSQDRSSKKKKYRRLCERNYVGLSVNSERLSGICA